MISTESKTPPLGQINASLEAGNYSRALNLLRGASVEFPNDPKLLELEKLAQDGIARKAEADRLITESQELFAQQKSAEALDLLRKAHELDKRNSLARAILANALVEHAQSVVETDWLKAETLTNQALAVNPAHPTAKTVLNQIVDLKSNSSVEDWVTQSRRLQSAGDLFGALAWVAEGLAVHPNDPKLLQIQEEIQRDQGARKRQARRGDLDDMRRMEREIAGAKDLAAKQALAERIQALAAKHWTDGEILSIANALLLRLGLVSQDSSSTGVRGKGSTLILHVPRPSASKSAHVDTSEPSPSPAAPSGLVPTPVEPNQILPRPASPDEASGGPALPTPIPAIEIPATSIVASAKVVTDVFPTAGAPKSAPPSTSSPKQAPAKIAPPIKARSTPLKPQPAKPQTDTAPASKPSAPGAKVTTAKTSTKQPSNSKFTIIFLVGVAAILAVAATFFFTRRHYAPVVPSTATVSAPAPQPASAPAPVASVSTPSDSTAAVASPEGTSSEPSPSISPAPSDTTETKAVRDEHLPPQANSSNVGALLIVAGQDGAKVSLNGKVQRQLTRLGQLSLPNLEPKDYVVQISKNGFQVPPQQTIRIRKGETAKLVFDLLPQPRLASLSIQGAFPGTTVLVDQAVVGSVQADGSLLVSTVNPGDRTVELRKDKFKPRQLKKTFLAGGTVLLAATDVALETAPGLLKITFTPADASVALVKGDLLKMVSSGASLSLPPGAYTLTARTAERFTRTATVEVVAGQSRNLDLSLAPNGVSKFQDSGAWKQEGESFTRKGGDFALYGVVPTSGTFVFSTNPVKGHLVQWVLNYTDQKNYVLFQIDENNFYRSVMHNGEKTDEIIVPHKLDKKSLRSLQIRVSSTEIVHQIKIGETWKFLDRWTQPGVNLSQGKFGFYVPGNDQIAVSNFANYADLNTR